MEVLSGEEWALMKEVRNREVQNKGCHTRSTSNGVYTVRCKINVNISSLVYTSHIIKACYGFIEGEEHLNKRICKLDSDYGDSVLHLGSSHPTAPLCFHCLLWTGIFFLAVYFFNKVTKIMPSTAWECRPEQFDFLTLQGEKTPTHVQTQFWESSAYCIHVEAAVSSCVTKDSFQALLLAMQ